jgi:16S rRNA (adenine1518-N6/adenine1519-N6)-dimethyltransferase
MKISTMDVKDLLTRYDLKPSKGLGQNFLVDNRALQRVIEAAEIEPEDEILEIGPGLGSLTRYLALAAKRVVAVELDRHMLPPLHEVLSPYNTVEIIQADILEVSIEKFFPRQGYLVVANIPYYITSSLLRHLLETPQPPSRLVLTVQKEVAERICARQGDLSLLALSVQIFGQPSIKGTIKAGSFYPIPKVDSAIVRIDLFPEPLISSPQQDTFFRLIKAGFSQKRKTLKNALSAGMSWNKENTEQKLTAAGIDPMRRAQTLSIEEWETLVQAVETN